MLVPTALLLALVCPPAFAQADEITLRVGVYRLSVSPDAEAAGVGWPDLEAEIRAAVLAAESEAVRLSEAAPVRMTRVDVRFSDQDMGAVDVPRIFDSSSRMLTVIGGRVTRDPALEGASSVLVRTDVFLRQRETLNVAFHLNAREWSSARQAFVSIVMAAMAVWGVENSFQTHEVEGFLDAAQERAADCGATQLAETLAAVVKDAAEKISTARATVPSYWEIDHDKRS